MYETNYLYVNMSLNNKNNKNIEQATSLKFRTNWNRITRGSSLITKFNSCVLGFVLAGLYRLTYFLLAHNDT